MKILTAQQLKAADAYTIAHEPIAPIDLMERAAQQCVNWLLSDGHLEKRVCVFCGKGGNGGDGLAIARLLYNSGITAEVYVLQTEKNGTTEFEVNRQRLASLPLPLGFISSQKDFPFLPPDTCIIDALYGFGLTRPLEGVGAALVHHLNNSRAKIISIDLPSGIFADASSKGNAIITATHTLTFECYKLGLLVSENALFIGAVHVLPIALRPAFLKNVQSDYELVDPAQIKRIYKPRNRFAHKGTFGHALLVGGSYGKIGAMVLATQACLRCGVGLVTTYAPGCGYTILQTTAPEAMALTDANKHVLTQLPAAMERFDAIGVGPGMGQAAETTSMLSALLELFQKPIVLDADALNIISGQPQLLKQLFQNTILTPHPKEFERLFGPCDNDFECIALAQKKAAEHGIIIILKGHHTMIAMPDGQAYFNSTGNAGMAKGGSGDVLTGMIASLLAQGYQPADAAVLGVYLHGVAGDYAANALSSESMTAADLVTFLADAFKFLSG